MKSITRIDENTVELADGRIVSYEATWKGVSEQHHGAYYENGEVVEDESEVGGREVDELTTDPQLSELDIIELEEWLNEQDQ
jgi:hypothetical protein